MISSKIFFTTYS